MAHLSCVSTPLLPMFTPTAPVCTLLQLYGELGMAVEARILAEQAEQNAASGGMLGSLRGAMGGLMDRIPGGASVR